MIKKDIFKNLEKKGFTLVELLISVSIFTIVVVVAIGALANISKANNRAQAVLVALENLDFSFEHMTRVLRTGEDISYCPGRNSCIIFTDYSQSVTGDRVSYEYDVNEKAIRRTRGSESFLITSPEVLINSFSVGLEGEDNTDTIQPRITLLVSGRTDVSSVKPDEQIDFNLQTTVNTRTPDYPPAI